MENTGGIASLVRRQIIGLRRIHWSQKKDNSDLSELNNEWWFGLKKKKDKEKKEEGRMEEEESKKIQDGS